MKPYVPKNMFLTHKPECNYTTSDKQTYRIHPCFAVDSDSEKMVKMAKRWSSGITGGWQTHVNKLVGGAHLPDVVIPNNPISNLKIISMESREEGGRAYKVITDDNKLFDFREDVLFDAIMNTGINNSGELPGQYIWVRTSPQNFKLYRLGSKLLNELVGEEVTF